MLKLSRSLPIDVVSVRRPAPPGPPRLEKDPDFGIVLQADIKKAPGIYLREKRRRR